MTAPPQVALLGHLESVDAYCALLGAARGPDLPPLQPGRLEPVLMHGAPMPLCDLRLRSPRGPVVSARYIDLAFVADWLRVVDTMAKVHAGCVEAVRSGARIAALGGFASILGERHGVDASAQFGIAFTTGNTLTAAVIADQVRGLTGDGPLAVVAVVGAGGDVGSGVSRILHAWGHRVLLVGRTHAGLRGIAAELEGAETATWEAAAPLADVVVLVASATQGELPLDSVRRDAWVLDAGHPPNARVPAGRYARAGRVEHAMPPESDLPELLSMQYHPGETHACLAEAEVLAFEGRWESFSARRGRIRPRQADEILALAARHGVTPGALHFGS